MTLWKKDGLTLLSGNGKDLEIGVITGHGYTLKTAAEEAIKNMAKINFPNRSGRTDLDRNLLPYCAARPVRCAGGDALSDMTKFSELMEFAENQGYATLHVADKKIFDFVNRYYGKDEQILQKPTTPPMPDDHSSDPSRSPRIGS
jgi:hypothetical protein